MNSGKLKAKTINKPANSDSGKILHPIPCNEVSLTGRVSSVPFEKELPSGDKVVEFRIIVDRKSSRGKKREVDALDIAAWSSVARKSSLKLEIEDWVEVSGAVRRRFWQAPSGLASRWQVEALQVRKLH